MTKTSVNAPSAPAKKPLTAYFQFMKEKRVQIKEENPTAMNKELVAIMGAQWRALTVEEKEGYKSRGKQGC